jgi:aspartate-semialdehyde dehydrogenase
MQVGFPGWRGMVGSVLHERMLQEGDFEAIEPVFLSTSRPGQPGPEINGQPTVQADAYDIAALSSLQAIVSCQGSAYTEKVHTELRSKGWDGYWIDAASFLRGADSAVLVLDPVNREVIDKALEQGKKDLIGAKCTVSTKLMGLAGLFKSDLVEYAGISTYQAVSGAGSKNIIEMLKQARSLGAALSADLDNPAKTILEIDRAVSEHLRGGDMPIDEFGVPIIGNILPWIDSEVDNGQSREELKGFVETNAILGLSPGTIVSDSTCVRVGSLRSHGQVVYLDLKKDVPLDELEDMISSAHEWVKVVPNNKQDTLHQLTPVATSGSLEVAVGRLRKLNKGPKHLGAFVVGDQLLWGAAEPLRRALKIVASR